MSGFDNEVMFTPGERLETSDANDIKTMQKGTNSVSRVNHIGDPNDGVTGVAANPSSLSHDPSSGFLWLKISGTGIPTWQRLFPSSSAPVLTLTGNTGGAIPPNGAGTINVITANTTAIFAGTGNTLKIDFNPGVFGTLAVGSSLPALTSGQALTAFGTTALESVTTGTGNVAVGNSALGSLTQGNFNTMTGVEAGFSLTGGALPVAFYNSGFGWSVLHTCTTGYSNSAFGYESLFTTNGHDNAAFGNLSLGSMTSGIFNCAFGSTCCQNQTTASNNSFFGYGAGFNVTTGGNNTGAGYNSLAFMTTGTTNIGLGYNSGINYNAAESSNIVIGHLGVNGESNIIRIGTAGGGAGQQNATFVAGITGVTVAASAPVAVASTGQLSSLGFGTSGQVLTSTGAGSSPTWQTISDAFNWLDASGAFAALADTGYFLTAAATPTLPLAPPQGTIIEFAVVAAATMTITANTGQFIQYAGSTSGAAGTLAASVVGNTVRLVYRTVGTTWWAIGSMGAAWTVT